MRDKYTFVIKSLPSVTDLAVSNVLASDAKFRSGSSSESCIIKRYFGGPFASALLIVALGVVNPAIESSRTISWSHSSLSSSIVVIVNVLAVCPAAIVKGVASRSASATKSDPLSAQLPADAQSESDVN